MIFLVISFIYSLFRLKARLINGNVWHDYKISFYIACLNGLQIKIMNFIYYYIAEYLNNWEIFNDFNQVIIPCSKLDSLLSYFNNFLHKVWKELIVMDV